MFYGVKIRGTGLITGYSVHASRYDTDDTILCRLCGRALSRQRKYMTTNTVDAHAHHDTEFAPAHVIMT